MTPIPIEVSSRHVHLCTADRQTLFGPSALHPDREISQRPQFLARERVTLRGPKGEMTGVGIVGPDRPATQVELSLTDARRLGITAPVIDSGHLQTAAMITIIGPQGEKTLPAAIVPRRHIHMSPDEARVAHLTNDQEVSVTIDGERGVRFDRVIVRINPSFRLNLHLDTDEGNACGAAPGMTATLVP